MSRGARRRTRAGGRRAGIALVVAFWAVQGACAPRDAPVAVPSPGEPGRYGDWMARAPRDWPRIAMINEIEYVDKKHPSAACGFLLDTGEEILAATAKHVLRYFKSSAMDSVSFEGTLESWRMFPKGSPGEGVVVDRLINEDPHERLDRIPSSRDWLLFTVRESKGAVQPLRLRSNPLRPGETVYVIGWRHTDQGRQRVHRGRFVRIEAGSVLVSIDALAENTVPGLSGAPVIDAGGYVVGLMSAKAGKLQRLAPSSYARERIEAWRRSMSDGSRDAVARDGMGDRASRVSGGVSPPRPRAAA